MARKIARQSEVTPLNTVDEYLWNQRLGITQLPEAGTQGQPTTSSLPPQPSQALAIDYDSSSAQSDMFGSGVSGADQLIAPKAPMEVVKSTPAMSKASSSTSPFGLAEHLMDAHGMSNDLIRDHDENSKLHDEEHSNYPTSLDHKHSYKTAVSTLYGDVEPTPTTGESSNNGSQSNRNNSSDDLPNGPDSSSAKGPAAAGEEEGGAGLAADLGEAASLAVLASKRWIGSTLDPVNDNLKTGKYHYIRKEGDQYCIWQKSTGKTLSCHDSKEKAEAAFRGMEMSKHG